jgi:hypothetical protein
MDGSNVFFMFVLSIPGTISPYVMVKPHVTQLWLVYIYIPNISLMYPNNENPDIMAI